MRPNRLSDTASERPFDQLNPDTVDRSWRNHRDTQAWPTASGHFGYLYAGRLCAAPEPASEPERLLASAVEWVLCSPTGDCGPTVARTEPCCTTSAASTRPARRSSLPLAPSGAGQTSGSV